MGEGMHFHPLEDAMLNVGVGLGKGFGVFQGVCLDHHEAAGVVAEWSGTDQTALGLKSL